MYVTPETFAKHAEVLAAEFCVMGLDALATHWATGRELPRRACVITFDDGWRDVVDYALPALKRHELPAALFVVTDRVETLGAFWPDEVCRRLARSPLARASVARELGVAPSRAVAACLEALKMASIDTLEDWLVRIRELDRGRAPTEERELATWAELASAHAAGFQIESHSVTHAILTSLPPERLRLELRESREALRARGMGQSNAIAYPSGAVNPAVALAAKAAGYEIGLSTRNGLALPGDDPLLWPRVSLHEDVSSTTKEFVRRIAVAP